MISKEGQFRLIALGPHRTRVEGTSWYQHGLWPAQYWRLWSDAIVYRIHMRVLEHIRALAEADSSRAAYSHTDEVPAATLLNRSLPERVDLPPAAEAEARRHNACKAQPNEDPPGLRREEIRHPRRPGGLVTCHDGRCRVAVEIEAHCDECFLADRARGGKHRAGSGQIDA